MTTDLVAHLADSIALSLGSDDVLYEGIDDPRVVALLKEKVESGALDRGTLVAAAGLRRANAHRQPQRRPTYVYFLVAEATGLIKIGSASDPESRMRTLQTGCPDRLSLVASVRATDAPAAERWLHSKFAADRVRGEWFYPSAELLAYIEDVA